MLPLGDFVQAKNNVHESILVLDSCRRAGIVQTLVWYYWKRCFIKTKLAIERKPELIDSCRNFHFVLQRYKDFRNNFDGFDWTWVHHFMAETRNWEMECDSLNNEYLK